MVARRLIGSSTLRKSPLIIIRSWINSSMSKQDSTIAFFMPGLYGGGAEDVILKLAANFSRRSVNIDLVVVKDEGELKDRVPDEVNLVDLGAGRIATSFYSLFRYLRSKRPDILVSVLLPTNAVAILTKSVLKSRVPTIIIEQNTT